MDINLLDTQEIIDLYPKILRELKARKVITSNNFVGEVGEYLVIDFYSKNASLPSLQKANVSTQNIDAISNTCYRVGRNFTKIFYQLFFQIF